MTDAPKKKRKYLTRRGRPSMKPTHYIMLGSIDPKTRKVASEIPRFGTGMRGVVLMGERGKWVSLYYPALNVRARISKDLWETLTGRGSRCWPGEYRTERGRRALHAAA